MSKRTIALIAILFISTVGLLALALNNPSNPVKNTVQKLVTQPVEQTSLSFGTLSATSSPSVALAKEGSAKTINYSIPVNIKTNSNIVTAVQLELQYDPEVLDNAKVEAGNFFTNPITLFNDVDKKSGRISFALGISLDAKGKSGEGTVAMLTFSMKTPTQKQQTTITFLPKSLVTAEGVPQSVLKSTTDAQIQTTN